MGAHRVGQETPVHRKLICFGLFREKVSFLIFLDKQYILSFTPRKLVSPMNSLSESSGLVTQHLSTQTTPRPIFLTKKSPRPAIKALRKTEFS